MADGSTHIGGTPDAPESPDSELARLRYLAAAGEILEASLDYETTLKELGQLVVPALADWCSVDLVDAEGRVTNIAVAHTDPTKVELARELRRRYQPRPDDQRGVVAVVRTGRSEWHREVPEELLEEVARDPDLLDILRSLGLRSAVTVPLAARGATLGALTLVNSESGRLFEEADLVLAEEMGRRAGLAIENARLLADDREARADAQEAEARLRVLSAASRALASSLDLGVTLQRVVDLAAEHLANSAAVYLPEDGGHLRSMAFAAGDPRQRAALQRLQEIYQPSRNPASHVWQAFVTKRTQAMKTVDLDRLAAEVDPETGELLAALEVRSGMSLPLVAGERVMGVLALGWRTDHIVDELDLDLAEELTARMTRAIQNAQLFAAERLASERISIVSRATALLAESLDAEAGFGRLAELVTEEFADFCLIDLLGEDRTVQRVAALHRDPSKQHVIEGFLTRPPTLEGNVPAAVAMRTRSPVFQDIDDEVLASFAADREHLDLLRQIGGINFIAVPLVARNRVLGALTLSSTTRRYGSEDVDLAKELAGRAALHLDNGRLYAAEARAARQAAKLQSIVDVTFSAGTLEELLQELLQRVTEELGTDLAGILLMDEDEPVLRMRAAIGLEDSTKRAVSVPVGRGFAGRIAATRQPMVVQDLRSFDVVSSYLKERVRSIVGVPLLIDREVVGVLHTSSVARRSFGDDDVSLLQLAAERAAVAIRRAQLYERQEEIASLLQRSLLPNKLPDIPGVELAVLFRAAGRAVEVGGDFYDAFPLGPDTWAVIVGDVCGRGPQAAAVTALARNAVRTIAMRGGAPAEVLDGVNEVMIRSGVDRFCTAVYAEVRPTGTGLATTVVRAGHPPALVLRTGGTVEEILPPGMLLGVFEGEVAGEQAVWLAPGESLVMYTDGLVERNPSLKDRGALAHLLQACQGMDAEEIVARIGEHIDSPAGGPGSDDIAILVLRMTPAPAAAPAAAAAGITGS